MVILVKKPVSIIERASHVQSKKRERIEKCGIVAVTISSRITNDRRNNDALIKNDSIHSFNDDDEDKPIESIDKNSTSRLIIGCNTFFLSRNLFICN